MEYINKHNCNKIKTKHTIPDKEYLESISKVDHLIFERILDNVDTRGVLDIILNNITLTYKYLDTDYNITFVNKYITQITKIFSVLGLNFDKHESNIEDEKCIDCLVEMREQIRKIITDKKKSVEQIYNDVSTVLYGNEHAFKENKKFGKILNSFSNDIFNCVKTYYAHDTNTQNEYERQNIRKDLVAKLFVLLDNLRDKTLFEMNIKIQDLSSNSKTKWMYF